MCNPVHGMQAAAGLQMIPPCQAVNAATTLLTAVAQLSKATDRNDGVERGDPDSTYSGFVRELIFRLVSLGDRETRERQVEALESAGVERPDAIESVDDLVETTEELLVQLVCSSAFAYAILAERNNGDQMTPEQVLEIAGRALADNEGTQAAFENARQGVMRLLTEGEFTDIVVEHAFDPDEHTIGQPTDELDVDKILREINELPEYQQEDDD